MASAGGKADRTRRDAPAGTLLAAGITVVTSSAVTVVAITPEVVVDSTAEICEAVRLLESARLSGGDALHLRGVSCTHNSSHE